MKESVWMYVFFILGLTGIFLINLVGQLNTSNEQNYYLLKEVTEAAMIDAVDVRAYREGLGYDGLNQETAPDQIHCVAGVPGTIRIVEEKFIESLTRRFAENAQLKRDYEIIIHDLDECPPKVAITLKSKQPLHFLSFFTTDYESDSDVTNVLTAILENTVKTP